jgi:hypothetical protein
VGLPRHHSVSPCAACTADLHRTAAPAVQKMAAVHAVQAVQAARCMELQQLLQTVTLLQTPTQPLAACLTTCHTPRGGADTNRLPTGTNAPKQCCAPHCMKFNITLMPVVSGLQTTNVPTQFNPSQANQWARHTCMSSPLICGICAHCASRSSTPSIKASALRLKPQRTTQGNAVPTVSDTLGGSRDPRYHAVASAECAMLQLAASAEATVRAAGVL